MQSRLVGMNHRHIYHLIFKLGAGHFVESNLKRISKCTGLLSGNDNFSPLSVACQLIFSSEPSMEQPKFWSHPVLSYPANESGRPCPTSSAQWHTGCFPWS